MLSEFIEKIQKSYKPITHIGASETEDGREFAIYNKDMAFKELTPAMPAKLKITNLSGIVQYMIDTGSELFIHIENYRSVSIVSAMEPKYKTREIHLVAEAFQPSLSIGHYTNIEDFIIFLMTSFVQDENIINMMDFLGNFRSEDVCEDDDDGVSQKVMVRSGVTTVNEARVPNPVVLQPYSTFSEIDQPKRPFVFRMKKSQSGEKPDCALFTTENSLWQLECIEKIRAFLTEQIKGVKIIS